MITVFKMLTFKNAKLTPMINASMLVAIERLKINHIVGYLKFFFAFMFK